MLRSLRDTRQPALADLFWPAPRLHEGLAEVIVRSELPCLRSGIQPVEGSELAPDFERWLAHAARDMGLEGDVRRVNATSLDAAIETPAPYLVVALGRAGRARTLALVRGKGRKCFVLRPDGTEQEFEARQLCGLLRRSVRPTTATALFDELPGGKAALAKLIAANVLEQDAFVVVRYELAGNTAFAAQLAQRGLWRRVLTYAAIGIAQGITTALAAFTLGSAAVSGVVDLGRLVAWSLLAASYVPLQYLATLTLGAASLDVAEVFKKRLLEGALSIRDTELRGQGFGAQLARLNEASVVEQTNVVELFGAFSPAIQLAVAVALLGLGVLPLLQCALWGVFVLGAVVMALLFHRRYCECYAQRLGLTEDLVEKVVGHRTRAVQANPKRWHDEEDSALHAYAKTSASLNALSAAMDVYGRAWLVAAGLILLFGFTLGVSGAQLIPTSIGIFLTYISLPALLAFTRRLSSWLCAWTGVRPLFEAGKVNASQAASPRAADEKGRTTIVSSLSFAYNTRPLFDNTSLRIEHGERILIGGPSGGGKTTFSKLLTGELRPDSGTILVNGVDCASVSEVEWRKRIVSSPQFHENYVFCNTFGFNVDPRGLEGELSPAAREVCFELGLRELLGRMPSRAAQLLGETGWQLSHGERSRVFIARSLLQGADLLIFDESFAALDPESLALALRCVRKRAPTLLVIAHQ